ncbi:hypothetical protein HN419_01585 [Candidatus Woesearchaeota archaeon]|jgi:uncharacterized membrane protein SpoIIM required for sporulation|nr:hypothetical protein [Candidatus Woesearchaeota archaeon]MBT3537311.1 hypothetical protein [Candidatus Woesearchaeota archaeon]MBT4697430.1 hypothetical protein [Candidatus Woesearchaeota archaeon]MBT4716723.1 hypothetical protein [Candidatus Woesearchaeota archaeon]MBT7106379.1 hypothetical protein [Candidatus Woesearchaeota archaeon]
MVFESIINPLSAEKRPWILLFIGFLYASLALLLALWIFSDQAGLIMVFLTVLASVPFIYKLLKGEEEKDLVAEREMGLLKEHTKALSYLTFLFIGITIAFTFWYLILPAEVSLAAFEIQADTISQINSPATGHFIGKTNVFFQILLNNLKVLAFCILFSFFYGAGAIFILTWNASVIATAIGMLAKSKLNAALVVEGASHVISYASILSSSFLRYFTHGIFEILAYFVGGLAGGIISFAVINHHFGTKKFYNVLMDSSDLLIISVVILFFAAVVEVFVTPALF